VPPPSDQPPFFVAGASAPASPVAGAAGTLAAAAIVGVPAGTIMGTIVVMRPHSPVGLPFFVADASTPVGLTAGAAGPWPLQPSLAPSQALARESLLAPS
jgi:hypothetical protein